MIQHVTDDREGADMGCDKPRDNDATSACSRHRVQRFRNGKQDFLWSQCSYLQHIFLAAQSMTILPSTNVSISSPPPATSLPMSVVALVIIPNHMSSCSLPHQRDRFQQVRRLKGAVRPFGSKFFSSFLTSIAAPFLVKFLYQKTFF